MKSLIVIELELLWPLEDSIHHRVGVIYVYFFILNTAPEAFNKDIIQGSATAIHTDGHSVWLQLTGEFIIGEFTSWSRLNISAFDHCNALPVSGDRTLSQGLWIPYWKEHTDSSSYDGHQRDESGSQAHISDVSGPDMVGTIYGQPLYKYGCFWCSFHG